jgi:hypothetical protein
MKWSLARAEDAENGHWMYVLRGEMVATQAVRSQPAGPLRDHTSTVHYTVYVVVLYPSGHKLACLRRHWLVCRADSQQVGLTQPLS